MGIYDGEQLGMRVGREEGEAVGADGIAVGRNVEGEIVGLNTDGATVGE